MGKQNLVQRILIVEDEKAIRQMLRMSLEAANFEVFEAEDAKGAKLVIADQLPDLILLDWMLPNQSGVEFTQILKKDKLLANIPIIMLTARAEEDNKIKGLEAGVDDYVVKPFSPRELIARIRAVLRRGPVELPDGKITVGDLTLDRQSQQVTIADKNVHLGPIEFRLLSFFMTHQNRVYSRDELLTYVWGGDAYLDERTVDVHIRRLRKRISINGNERLIQTIHGSGYLFLKVEKP